MDPFPPAERRRPAPAGRERGPAEGGDLYKAHDPRRGASLPADSAALDDKAAPPPTSSSSSSRTPEPGTPTPALTPSQPKPQPQQDQAASFSYRALQRRSSPSPPNTSLPPPPLPPASWLGPEGWSEESSRTGSGAGSLPAVPSVASGSNPSLSEPRSAATGSGSPYTPASADTRSSDHSLAASNPSGSLGSDFSQQSRPDHRSSSSSVEARSVPPLATCESAPQQRAPSRLQTFFSSDEEEVEVASPETAGDRTALLRAEKGQQKKKTPKKPKALQGKDGAPETPNYSTFARPPPAPSGMEPHKEKGSGGQDGWSSSPYTSKSDMISNGSGGGAAAGKDGGERRPGGNRFFVYMMACFATIGGLLFGYDTGIVSGSMLLIQPFFDLSTVWQEVIVSGTIGAAAVFALIAGYVGDRLGRKMTIMIASFIFAAGAIIMAVSPNKETLLGGRIVVGVGIGFASMIVPVYVAEVAPTDIRGRLVTLNQLFITIGILVSSIIAGAFSEDKENGWRYMLGLAAAPGVIQFLGFFYLPESPRWLAMKGREEEARAVLKRIRGHDDVEDEMNEIRESETNKEEGVALGKIFTTPHVRKALLIGCGLQLFQQLCGINTVIYYSATILKNAGFPPKQAIWLVCVPFGVNFLATFIGVWLVERLGRKLLLIVSFVGVTVALVVLGLGFLLSAKHSPSVNVNVIVTYDNGTQVRDGCQGYKYCEACILNSDCGFCYDEKDSNASTCLMVATDRDDKDLYSSYGRCRKNGTQPAESGMKWSYGYCATDYTWMAVLGLALFVLSFAPGLGPMPWTINSEIYPMWARGTGVSISTMINWAFNLVVSFSFLSLLEAITKYGTFFLFCGICVLGTVFTAIFVPETKNKSLEEVEELFMTKEKREVARKQREARQDIVIPDPLDHNKIDTRF